MMRAVGFDLQTDQKGEDHHQTKLHQMRIEPHPRSFLI
jgi:hypothetical protein